MGDNYNTVNTDINDWIYRRTEANYLLLLKRKYSFFFLRNILHLNKRDN